jgi:catalase
VHFVTEAYKHPKPAAAFDAGIDLLCKAGIEEPLPDGEDVVAGQGPVSTTVGTGRPTRCSPDGRPGCYRR